MQSPFPPSHQADVTVLGCGLMGSALVRTLAEAGHHVVAWNRTHERAAALVAERVKPVRSIDDAVKASPLLIACLSSYENVRTSLEDTDLGGRALVNVSTGTPDRATELDAWAAARGIDYLDGAILAFPDFVGSPDAILAYSGSRRVWDDHEDLMRCLGGQSQWISEDTAAANAFDGALIVSFYTAAVGAYVEAATYALDHGVSPDLLRSATRMVLRTLAHSTKEAVTAIDSGDYSTDQAKLSTYAVGARDLLRSARGAGLPARMLAASVESLDAACAAGLGDLGLYAQAEVMRTRAGR